jgi:branched-chain amino acid transport system ATP-binding protein
LNLDGSLTRPGGNEVLETVSITQSFGGVTALKDVSLQLEPGRVHALIGPNGAGKTTLFDIISGVLRPTSGHVLLDERDISRVGAVGRARLGIRRTFQRQQPIGWLSVEDNVVAAMDWRGGGGGTVADLLGLFTRRRLEAARRTRASEVLELCGLVDYGSVMAGGLTIAQARMLEFARALADKPQVLLLDEPTSGLAEDGVEQATLILEIAREQGCAIGLVEHDVSFVTAVSDTITVLNFGTIIAQGTPSEIVSHPAVRLAYLGEVGEVSAEDAAVVTSAVRGNVDTR